MKFVLRIRRPHYWRIELSAAQGEDQEKASELKEVLDRILQFEKTHCPFVRTFTVEIPEPPTTPLARRPWTPQQSTASNPVTEALRGSLDHRMYFQARGTGDVPSLDASADQHQSRISSSDQLHFDEDNSPLSVSLHEINQHRSTSSSDRASPLRLTPAEPNTPAHSSTSINNGGSTSRSSTWRPLRSRWSWTSEDLPADSCGCAECVADRALNSHRVQQTSGSQAKCWDHRARQQTTYLTPGLANGLGMLWRRSSLPATIGGGVAEGIPHQNTSDRDRQVITSLESLQSKLLTDTNYQGTIAGPADIASSSDPTEPSPIPVPPPNFDSQSIESQSNAASVCGPIRDKGMIHSAAGHSNPRPAKGVGRSASLQDTRVVSTDSVSLHPQLETDSQFPSQDVALIRRQPPSYESFSPVLLHSFRMLAKACKLLLVPPILISALALRAGGEIANRVRASRLYSFGFGIKKDQSMAAVSSTDRYSSSSDGDMGSEPRPGQIRRRTVTPNTS